MKQLETRGACLSGDAPLPVESTGVTLATTGGYEWVTAQMRDEARAVIEALGAALAEGADVFECVYREQAQPYMDALRTDLAAVEAAMAGFQAALNSHQAAGSRAGEQPDGHRQPAEDFSLDSIGAGLRRLSGKEAVALVLLEADGRPVTTAEVATRLADLGHPTTRENVRTQLSRAANSRYGEPSAATADGLWTITDHGREVADGVLQLRGLRAAR